MLNQEQAKEEPRRWDGKKQQEKIAVFERHQRRRPHQCEGNKRNYDFNDATQSVRFTILGKSFGPISCLRRRSVRRRNIYAVGNR